MDWYPWGPEALAQAATLGRPILLSIGYSSCHWCHVMERESFENEATAALMNQHFVCIKVDREERPDLDEIYMQATLALNRNQGGWPMTVFLTPDQKPFLPVRTSRRLTGGADRGFRRSSRNSQSIGKRIARGVVAQAANLTVRLRDGVTAPSPTTVGEAELDMAVTQFAEDFDAKARRVRRRPSFHRRQGCRYCSIGIIGRRTLIR